MPNDKPLPWSGLPAGLAAGLADTAVNYPAYGIKIRKQCSENITWKLLYPRELYRSVIPYGLSAIPITVLQDGISTRIKSYYRTECPLADAAAAFFAGTVSSFVSTPVNNIIVTQQLHFLSPQKAIRQLASTQSPGRFWRGLTPTILRDGPYCLSAFWGVMTFGKYLSQTFNLDFDNYKVVMSAGISTAIMTTIVTQPADTVATKMQACADGKISAWQVTKGIVRKDGMKGLYKGTLFRGGALIGGMIVIPLVSEAVKKRLSK